MAWKPSSSCRPVGSRARMAAPSALCGTPVYMAPEVVAADAAHLRTRRFAPYDGCAADAWSAGVTLFEAAFGWPPFRPPAKALDPLAEMAALHAAWVRPRCLGCTPWGVLSAVCRLGRLIRSRVWKPRHSEPRGSLQTAAHAPLSQGGRAGAFTRPGVHL